MSKITNIDLNDLNENLGTHEFEIVDISTEWCQPCHELKKLMKKTLDSKDFKNVDLQVYVLDGDVCSSLTGDIALAKAIKEKNEKFPMSDQEFLKILKEINKAEGSEDYKDEEWKYIMESACDGIIFENKAGKIYMNNILPELEKISNPYTEFEVNAFPTIIFYRKGKPIEKPLEEKDYASRGFEYYDEKLHDGNMDAVVLEIIENGEKTKIIQTNKKLDARMVGFNDKELPNLLKKFIQ